MKHYIDFIAEQLKTLTAIPSPSGYTKNATDYLMKLLQDMGYEPKLSRKGNVFVTRGGDGLLRFLERVRKRSLDFLHMWIR